LLQISGSCCMWVVETQICVVVVSAFCFREAAVVRGVRARDEAAVVAGASFPKPWTPEGDGVIVTWLASRLESQNDKTCRQNSRIWRRFQSADPAAGHLIVPLRLLHPSAKSRPLLHLPDQRYLGVDAPQTTDYTHIQPPGMKGPFTYTALCRNL
jgi:hypothetical protein